MGVIILFYFDYFLLFFSKVMSWQQPINMNTSVVSSWKHLWGMSHSAFILGVFRIYSAGAKNAKCCPLTWTPMRAEVCALAEQRVWRGLSWSSVVGLSGTSCSISSCIRRWKVAQRKWWWWFMLHGAGHVILDPHWRQALLWCPKSLLSPIARVERGRSRTVS